MFIRMDHYLGKSHSLLRDAEELRLEAERHFSAGNDEEGTRLLEKHKRLVAKSMRYNDKALGIIERLEARR